MKIFDIGHTNYTVADFLGWQQEGRLRLSPAFQRRSVWTTGHKSYLVDTVVRGLPVPVVFIRDTIDLNSKSIIREMVDGQQRIRTLLSYVEPSCLPDFDDTRDAFTVTWAHNSEIAGKPFVKLPEDVRIRILTYAFSTHVLPLGTEDRDVLQIFARMNSTGLKLSPQELRNAQFFGPFKTLMYELATEQLDRWRQWHLFSEDSIARMKEVELVSDLTMSMIDGLKGKTQARINELYKRFDQNFPGGKIAADRFRSVMECIDRLLGDELNRTVYRSEVNFFTLFVYLYDVLYGLGSELKVKKPALLPEGLESSLENVSSRIRRSDVPEAVLDAIQRASADLGRRRTRLKFMHAVSGTTAAG